MANLLCSAIATCCRLIQPRITGSAGIPSALTAEADPALLGQHCGQFATTPLGMDRAVLQRVLIDEAIEVLLQLAGEFGRSTRARAIHQTRRALAGKAIDPLAEGGIGKGEGVRDGLQALPFHDLA